MSSSDERTSGSHGIQYMQKPDSTGNQTKTTMLTTSGEKTSNNNIEIITEESVIQYLNEILSVYLNEVSSPPASPYDNETFFFEKPVSRTDSKIFDIHYSNEGRQQTRKKSLKVESPPLKNDKIELLHEKHDTTMGSSNDKIKYNSLAKSSYQQLNYSKKVVSIDYVNNDKYHSAINKSSRIDSAHSHNETNIKGVTQKTEKKILRKVCSIPLENSNKKLDNGQTKINKNNINTSSNRLHQNDLSGKTILNDKQKHVTEQNICVSISIPHTNNNKKERAKSMIIDNSRRTNKKYSLRGKSTNRSTQTCSSSSQEQPNKEFTVSLYKTETTSPTTIKTGGVPENTKLVCTMYIS